MTVLFRPVPLSRPRPPIKGETLGQYRQAPVCPSTVPTFSAVQDSVTHLRHYDRERSTEENRIT
jgi:hypothetical protein